MNILIIGAGAVGSVIARFLSKDPDVSRIVCASKDVKRAREFMTPVRGTVRLVQLDATDVDGVARAARGMDLIINASLPRFNERLLEAALRARTNYQDLASDLLDLRTPEQLAFHARFKKAGLVGLINTGVAPGISNLFAKEAAERLTSVDEIHFRCIEDQEASEFIFSWSADTTLDDLTAPPLVYRKGRFVLTKPFADPEEFRFPAPFGKRHAFSIYGDEVATVPLYIKTRVVDFKSSGSEIEFSRALSRLGLFSKRPMRFNGKEIIPLDYFKRLAPKVPSPKEMRRLIASGVIKNAVFALTVQVIGSARGAKRKVAISTSFPDLKEIHKRIPGATYISYPTGLAAYAFAKIVPKIKSGGVFPPEALDMMMRHQVMRILKKNGIVIRESSVRA